MPFWLFVRGEKESVGGFVSDVHLLSDLSVTVLLRPTEKETEIHFCLQEDFKSSPPLILTKNWFQFNQT